MSSWYSLDSSRWVLSDEYPFTMVSVIFRMFLYLFVLTKLATSSLRVKRAVHCLHYFLLSSFPFSSRFTILRKGNRSFRIGSFLEEAIWELRVENDKPSGKSTSMRTQNVLLQVHFTLCDSPPYFAVEIAIWMADGIWQLITPLCPPGGFKYNGPWQEVTPLQSSKVTISAKANAKVFAKANKIYCCCGSLQNL